MDLQYDKQIFTNTLLNVLGHKKYTSQLAHMIVIMLQQYKKTGIYWYNMHLNVVKKFFHTGILTHNLWIWRLWCYPLGEGIIQQSVMVYCLPLKFWWCHPLPHYLYLQKCTCFSLKNSQCCINSATWHFDGNNR